MALLQDHIAVVTGAGSGIGRAIASGYAREGARVVLLDINETAAGEVAKEIRDGSGKADSFALDVTRREDCVAVAKQMERHHLAQPQRRLQCDASLPRPLARS